MQPLQGGRLPEELLRGLRVRNVVAREDPVGRTLVDRKTLDERGDLRHELQGARAGAHDGDVAAAQVVAVVPARRVEAASAERGKPREARDRGSVERRCARRAELRPTSLTRTSAVKTRPSRAWSLQTRASSSKRADAISQPYFDAIADAERVRAALQVGEDLGLLGRSGGSSPGSEGKRTSRGGEGTSHAHPGYALSRQVPPMPCPFSKRVKVGMPACSRRAAMQSPEIPVPRMATRGVLVVSLGPADFIRRG